MTKNQKQECYQLRQQGVTLAELGIKYGVSRERIRQIMNAYEKRRNGVSTRLSMMVYPALRHWMIVHGATYTSLAEECGVAPQTTRNGLTGMVDIKKSAIDAILDVTGMTYEQAFRK